MASAAGGSGWYGHQLPCKTERHAATRYQQQMSTSLDAAVYAVVYSVLLRHDAPSLTSFTLSGADWTFTQLICLMGGPGEGELATSTASVVRAIRRCMVRAGNTLQNS